MFIYNMSETNVRIFSRDLFLSSENIATINSSLNLHNVCKINCVDLIKWYDSFIILKQIECSKIDNAVIWSQYMTEEFIKKYKGDNFLSQAEVPYLPFDGAKHGGYDKSIQTRSDGKFPKFNLKSAIEDKRDENGSIVIRNPPAQKNIYTTARPWRHPTATGPVPKLLQLQQRNGWRNMDKEYTGTLNTRQLVNRDHTKRDLSPFLIREDQKKVKKAGIASPVEYWW
jgi:hypothetical protein